MKGRTMSRIVKLEAENVKRLRAVCIEPNGKPVVVIGGRNGQGKTSVLDSIEYALGGKPDVAQPIRRGESNARVVVETEDLVVTRVFTAGGSRLEVQGKAGELRHVIKSPQALLDKLVGKLAFDPLAFSRMDAKAQVETLKALVGVDFAKLDEERRNAYDERTSINRAIKALRAQADGMPNHPDAPAEEVSVSELAEELERRTEQNRTNDEKRRKVTAAAQSVADIEREIEEIRKRLDTETERLAEAAKKHESWKKLADGLEDAKPEEIRDQMRNAEAVNGMVRENQKRISILAQVERKESEAKAYTDRIAAIDSEKGEALAKANFPVDGLAFDENVVTFGGIPFTQCSSAEQLRVSVAMGLSLHRDLKLLLIRDGSLLDADSLRMVEEMAKEADATIMIERVGDGEEVSVVIEDGLVREIR
jgi:DNA repair exonuclease SbcCD ATPase subunit